MTLSIATRDNGLLDLGIAFYHAQWGNKDNLNFFKNVFQHSDGQLPKLFLLMDGNEIAGCCGLAKQDFVSRQDLGPWLVGLYVNEGYRGRSLGSQLMQAAQEAAEQSGWNALYLITDLDGYYEKYGWQRIEDGYELNGGSTRIYMKST